MEPKVYSSKDHHIRNNLIDKHALSVLHRLQEAGHTAYLVGGGVRDLLLKKKPKDFDISTSAKPEEVKALFRNCILIGRRFRLAHVRFGRHHIIEVATFRSGDATDSELIVRDNIWGTPEEDVLRRDFTINGLFYDPTDHSIIDYVGGYDDLQKHLLRAIGDPQMRFRQDPVRMIRMLKFQARFDFKAGKKEGEALKACLPDITKSSAARVLEEMFRMLESGAAASFFKRMVKAGMLAELFPKLDEYFKKPVGEEIFAHLEACDAMNKKGGYRPLDRSILTAALLFPILDERIEEGHKLGEIMDLAQALIYELLFLPFSHFPKKIRQQAHAIMHLQYRLIPLDKRRHPRTRIVRQKAFPAALTFLKLRSLVEPALFKEYERWKRRRDEPKP
ncbi:MAG: Poly(A) polymerase I [Chlamydiales bacterium]|nr:Poly(A) polymerase I [Chlamydiales bacterium]MCH9635561.1 Poly(A) polymerase I [Chlamydiales bacterium]MCH9703960.1 polynucleotide adenylyltransferase PcnB [Chlamydiota bacterium]